MTLPLVVSASDMGSRHMRIGAPKTGSSHDLLRWIPILVLMVFAGCSDGPDTDAQTLRGAHGDKRWNVVLVTFDTTRADHFGCYGHPSARTPIADGLADEGVLFERAFTPVPITLPSHSTIMTGKVPFTHGVRDNGMFVLSDGQDTLAEILRRNGYRTGAAVGAFPVASQFGLDQGFEFYDDRLATEYEDVQGDRIFPKEQLFFDERKAGRVNEALFPWLEKNHDEPFFAWFHYFDPHFPFEPPAPYDHLHGTDLYLGEISYADECLGKIIAKLKELDVYDDTIIVFTGDHGEGRGEHNESTHAWLVYNSTLHVPLIIRVPGELSGVRVPARVGMTDILPTILDLLDLPPVEGIQGKSLAGYLDGSVPAETLNAQRMGEPLYAESISPRLSHGYGELRALYLGDYKYIYGPRKELYEVTRDHAELENLVASKPEVAAEMEKKLAAYIKANAALEPAQVVPMSDETARKLMSLGYLGSSGTGLMGRERLRDDGIAPQDRVVDISLMSTARQLLYKKQPFQAKSAILELLERSPDNPTYLGHLADAEAMLGKMDEAYAILDRLVSLPDSELTGDRSRYLMTMARILVQQEKFPDAIAKLEECQEISKSARASYLMALVYKEMGQREEEFACLQETLELNQRHVAARVDLAVRYAQAGQRATAAKTFESALAEDPYYAKGYYNHGAFLVESGRVEEGMEALRRAVAIQPDYTLAHFSLAKLLLESGLDEEAQFAFREMKKQNPTHPLVDLLGELLSR